MFASFRVGIDVGGTFTDLYLLDEKGGSIVRHKLPSTPDNPYEAPIKGIQEILKDHAHRPQSLCRHRDDSLPESKHTITKTAMIMDLKEKKMWVTDGQPCKAEFEEYSLN